MNLLLLPDIFLFHRRLKFSACLLFFFLLLSVSTASMADKKSYLRLEKNEPSELNDVSVKSIGALVFEKDMEAHIDLSQIKSNTLGKSVALDFGAGYVFNWDVSVYLGIGLSLEYNQDYNDFDDKYYSEAGVVIDLSKKLSVTSRVQHFYNYPDDFEEVIMLGVMFRE